MRTFFLSILFFSLALSNQAKAQVLLTLSPTPQVATVDTILTIQSRFPTVIQIYEGEPGWEANIVRNGNIVNLDVVGFDILTLFPDVFTYQVNLGQFAAGSYELRLRFRGTPIIPGVPATVYPGVIARVNFNVGPGPTFVTQVPALTPGTIAALALLILALGAFAARVRH
jgi:hypothetical protein